MMKSLIKNNILTYLYDKRKILVVLVFSFFCWTELDIALMAGMSGPEFALFVMSNHYYVIYFLFMSYMFFFLDSLRMENENTVIRLTRIGNQYMVRVISCMSQAAIFVTLHVVLALFIGVLRLPGGNVFQAVTIEGYHDDTMEFLLEYTRYFESPLEAVLWTMLYMILGLTFLSMIIYVLYSQIGRKGAIIAIVAGILNMMIGFKTGVSGMAEVCFVNNYFIVHHVLFRNGARYVFLNCGLMIGLLILGYRIFKRIRGNRQGNRKNKYVQEMQKKNTFFSILFLLIYVGLNVISCISTEGELFGIDIVLTCLVGYSAVSFNGMEFLKYILFFISQTGELKILKADFKDEIDRLNMVENKISRKELFNLLLNLICAIIGGLIVAFFEKIIF